MAKVDRISLESEIATLRYELSLLQSSRSHRVAKYLRQVVSSSPKELPKLLGTLPSVFVKIDTPKPDLSIASQNLFNPLTNGLPLFCYPNINVALIASASSVITKLFNQTCNTFPLLDARAEELRKYDAIQIIAVDTRSYKKETHYSAIDSAIKSGSKLVIYSHEKSTIPSELNEKAQLVLSWKDGSLQPFADIYFAKQKSVKIPKDSDKKSRVIGSVADINLIDHTKINLVPRALVHAIETKGDFQSASAILTKIASYCPVIFEGQTPDWVSKEVQAYTDQKTLDSMINSLSEPFAAERYGIACGRDTIVQSNTAMSVAPLLARIGLIKNAQNKIPSVSVVLCTRRAAFIEKAVQQIEAQTLVPHELVVMLHGMSDSDIEQCKKVLQASSLRIIFQQVDKKVLFGDVLNEAVDLCTGDFITKVDDDDIYCPNHLLDLYAAHLSSRADYVGKWNNWVYIQSEDKTINWVPESANGYVAHLPGGTVFAKASVFRSVRFGKVKRAIDSEMYRRAKRRGASLYSTHRYNYVRVRHDDHTYNATEADFKSRSEGNALPGLPIKNTLSA